MTSGIPKFPNFNASLVKTQQIGGSQRQAVSCRRDYSLHKESEVGVIAQLGHAARGKLCRLERPSSCELLISGLNR